MNTTVDATNSSECSISNTAAAFGTAVVFEMLHSLLFVASTVVFMTWVYRAIANLPALGSMSCRFTPSGAVWSFFIPFVNLVRGHQVMATIWQESQPPAFNEHGFYLPRKTTIVNWWWGLYLFAGVVGIVRDVQRRQDEQFRDDELRRGVPAPTADALR